LYPKVDIKVWTRRRIFGSPFTVLQQEFVTESALSFGITEIWAEVSRDWKLMCMSVGS